MSKTGDFDSSDTPKKSTDIERNTMESFNRSRASSNNLAI